MSIRNNRIQIDKSKFKAACRKRGITQREACEACGLSKNYFSARVSEGYIPEYIGKLLKAELNMDRDEYEAKEEQMAMHAEPIQNTFTMPELYKVIYTAVYQAVKKADADIKKGERK